MPDATSDPTAIPPIPPISPGDATLLEKVRRCVDALAAVAPFAGVLDEATIQRAQNARADVSRRLERAELFVCIVGEKKSGKSTFLNAILGERILGAANREYTGAVTTVRRAERYNCTATFLDGTRDDFAASNSENAHEFQAAIGAAEAKLAELSAANSAGLEAQRAAHAELNAINAELDGLHAARAEALSAYNTARADADMANAAAQGELEGVHRGAPSLLRTGRVAAVFQKNVPLYFPSVFPRGAGAIEARRRRKKSNRGEGL